MSRVFFIVTACVIHLFPLRSVTAQDSTNVRAVNAFVYRGEHLSGGPWPAPAYSIRITHDMRDGFWRVHAVSVDTEGRAFFEQTVEFRDTVPISYTAINRVRNERSELRATLAEITMEFSRGGLTEAHREPRPALFAAGIFINEIVRDHIADLKAGKAVRFRMAVIDRLRTFELRAVAEQPRKDEPLPLVRSGDWLRLRVEPEDRVARLFAPKTYMVVNVRSGDVLLASTRLPSPDAGEGMIKRVTVRYDGAP